MVKGWPWTGSGTACFPAVPLLNLTGGEDESPPWLVHPAFSRVPGTWKEPPKAQLGAGGCGWGKEPLPEWVFRCEPGLALLGEAGGGTVERGPSSALQLQPPSSTALQWGEGKRGQKGAAGYAPPPSPGQRALGKKDLAKGGLASVKSLRAEAHTSVDVGVRARVRVCTTRVRQ